MFIPHEGPGTWQSFLKRKDNVGLTIMEARQKYLKEQLLFENYISTLNTLNTVSTAAAGAAGGPAPSTGGGGGGGEWDLEFTIDTTYSYTGNYVSPFGSIYGETSFSSTTAQIVNKISNPTSTFQAMNIDVNSNGGEITVDWGDGTVETLSDYNFTWDFSAQPPSTFKHDYATDGQYQIKIKGPGASTVKFFSLPVISIEKIDPTTIEWRGLFAGVPTTGTQIPLPNWIAKPTDNLAGMFGWVNNFDNATNTTSLNGFNADISTWDVSNVTSLNLFTAFNTYMSSNLSSWNTSNVADLLYFAYFSSAGQFTGWQNWDLSSVDGNTSNDIGNFSRTLTSLPNRVAITALWNGWVFDPTVASFNFSTHLDNSFVQDANVIGDWIISMANDVNTPNNISLDGNSLDGQGVYLASAPTTKVSIASLGLSSDPGVSTAISTLTGKGWTITNF